MPKVTFVREKKTIDVENGANLRATMLANDVSPYRGPSRLLNCHGRGDCKTCKVKIQPETNVSPKTHAELPRARGAIFQIIDHRELIGWRLSCQVKIRGDVEVTTQS
jgi:ferredoxin